MNKTYSEKLKDPRWQKKRLKILERDGFKCCYCGDEETTLNVHHKKYTGEPWEANNEDLETLCETCHSLEHLFKGSSIFIDPLKVVKTNIDKNIFSYRIFLKSGVVYIDASHNITYLADYELKEIISTYKTFGLYNE